MDVERLVDDYIKAWNQQDISQLFNVQEKRATYVDAFWMEYCDGRNLARYLQDSMVEENYWYERIGNVISVDNSVVYRYIAHDRTDSKIGPALFNGAEVLIFRDNKIFTISNYYCNPDQPALEEVAKLSARRYAETRHVLSGLSAFKASRFKSLLLDTMVQDQVYLDASLTQSKVAGKIGCSVDHLMQVIGDEYGTSFKSFLDQYRVKHARELLLKDSEDKNFVVRVAFQSGFESFENFNSSFRRLVGESPAEFRNRNAKKIGSTNDPIAQ